MGDQMWSIFIAGLGEMHLIPDPQRRPFLAVTGIEIIGGVDELGRGQNWLSSPLPALVERLKLLLEDSCAGS